MQCTVNAPGTPEMDVFGNGQPIADGSTTFSALNGTDLTTAQGTDAVQSYTIQNNGSAALTFGAVTATGDAELTVTLQPTSPIAASGSDTFEVTCDATTAGVYTTTISIPNNDSSENPYTFDVQCTVSGIPSPQEISVRGQGVDIPNGASSPNAADGTDFGTTPLNTAFTRTFRIRNDGGQDLTVGAVTAPAGFTVTAQPASPVAGGGSTTFEVQCDATAAGNFTGTISIPNDDSDEAPYTFAVACGVSVNATPELDSQPTAPGAEISFGNVSVGDTQDFTLSLLEVGTANLTISNIVVSGTGFALQSVTPALPFTIADNSGETIVVVVRCTPSGAGTLTGTLIVTHTAPGSPTNYPLTCTGTTDSGGTTSTPAPSVGVYDPAISKIGFLVPGQVGVTGERVEWIVTVRNNGGAAGTNVTITDTLIADLRVDSVEAPGASVSVNGQTVTVVYPTLAPGESVQFSIFTTVLRGETVSNTACVTAQRCATGSLVRTLPATGEPQPWLLPLLTGLVGLGLSLSALFGRRLIRTLRDV